MISNQKIFFLWYENFAPSNYYTIKNNNQFVNFLHRSRMKKRMIECIYKTNFCLNVSKSPPFFFFNWRWKEEIWKNFYDVYLSKMIIDPEIIIYIKQPHMIRLSLSINSISWNLILNKKIAERLIGCWSRLETSDPYSMAMCK